MAGLPAVSLLPPEVPEGESGPRPDGAESSICIRATRVAPTGGQQHYTACPETWLRQVAPRSHPRQTSIPLGLGLSRRPRPGGGSRYAWIPIQTFRDLSGGGLKLLSLLSSLHRPRKPIALSAAQCAESLGWLRAVAAVLAARARARGVAGARASGDPPPEAAGQGLPGADRGEEAGSDVTGGAAGLRRRHVRDEGRGAASDIRSDRQDAGAAPGRRCGPR